MSSLFLGIILINIGFAAGMWLKGQITQRQMNVVLRYDKERLMWREINDARLVSSDSDIIIGIRLPSSASSALQ